MLSVGSEPLLRVNDDGRGLGTVTREGELASRRDRAHILGGTFHMASEPAAWTQLEWRVPLHRD
jgi:signal transduction histidine kinase